MEPTASDPVLRVIDLSRLEVVASVPLGDATRISMGARGRMVSTPTGPAETPLKVISRPASVEPGTATVPVRLALTGPTRLPAHTPVNVTIDGEQHKDVVLVPRRAIVREGDQSAVFVVAEGNKAERRPVQIGLSDDEHVEIVSGVKAGELVIVDVQAGMPDGGAITVRTPDGSAQTTGVSETSKDHPK